MTRLAATFRELPEGEAALVAYVMAGDPDLEGSLAHASRVLEHADVLELGVPFSDPVADGPTIQAAGQRALQRGITFEDVLELARRIRDASPKPILLMGYVNPLHKRGYDAVAEAAAAAGVDGFIVPDVPLEESAPLLEAFHAHDLDLVQLASPASGPERTRRLAEATDGFLYLVSSFGVTGARTEVAERTRDLVQATRKEAGDVPVAVGFGVSTPDHVRVLREAGAHGVVVGSAIVERIGRGDPPGEVGRFVAALKRASRPTP